MNAPKRQHDALVRGGLKNWANAKVTMKRHQGEKKPGHRDAVYNYQQYQLSKNIGDVMDQIHTQSDKASSDRDEYLKRISTATQFLAKQGN